MACSRVVLCGLARNVADKLPSTIAGLESLGAAFADYRVVIYENDSNDGTTDILSAWSASNPKVAYFCEDRGDPLNKPVRCLRRAQRMAMYRNRCLNYLRDQHSDFDYVILVDTDLGWAWSESGIATTFAQDDWDFVGSYGTLFRCESQGFALVHYDTWAYREFGSYDPISTKQANLLHPGPPGVLTPVYSCFGGLGVYRMSALLSGSYSGEDCEHVTLHRRMRLAGYGKQFLNGEQTTHYGVRRQKKILPWDSVRRGLGMAPATPQRRAA